MLNKTNMLAIAVSVVLAVGSPAMGQTTIETVPVGNVGNTGEWSGESYGGSGPDRICGAVDYAYNIAKYEVTAGQYAEFLNAVAAVDAYGLYNTNMWSSDYGRKIERYDGIGTTGDPYQYRVAGDYAGRPVNYVSWGDAARFANWLHNDQPTGPQDLSTTEDGAYYLNGATVDSQLTAVTREADWKWAITSEDEWYKAAYYDPDKSGGPGYWDYPTSTDSAPGRDMTEVTNPGNNANYYGSPYPIDSPYYTTVAGEFELSQSPYGTFDQGGNLGEWNEAILYGSYRGLRGGSYGSLDSYLHAADRGNFSTPPFEGNYLGFRVSEVPEPASMAFLALGACLPLCRRRSRQGLVVIRRRRHESLRTLDKIPNLI